MIPKDFPPLWKRLLVFAALLVCVPFMLLTGLGKSLWRGWENLDFGEVQDNWRECWDGFRALTSRKRWAEEHRREQPHYPFNRADDDG